ncbi:peroxidase-related enzyme [Tropicimonas sp. IMCC34043]|uniref:peroxidase-related enzyme n=1 Tax=Tropicimonas sp. IMCC34043 TaxID=2248760 RepID=UPI000E25F997|nr:peroxidase-related enzyme [Tropicimonas sp. IMCC34043]
MTHPTRIAKVDLPDLDTLSDETRAYLQLCEEKLGLVPNVLLSYTINEAKLKTFSRFYNELMLGDSPLSKLEREMIAVVVSSCNHCYYCLVAHGQAVRALSGDPELGEMLVMNYRAANLPGRQRAMLDYAWKLTEDPHAIGDADREALRAEGFSDREIFDVTDTAAFFNYTNRVAHGIDMAPNREYHAMNR